MDKKTAIIIGAGPAGLTAALELLRRTDIRPVVFELTGALGGISRTVNYNGNRIDIGGHRFFSKSTRVMDWWLALMPLQGVPSWDDRQLGRQLPLSIAAGAPDPEKTDHVMLVRERLSRILFRRKFFDYPLTLSLAILRNLGLGRTTRIGFSYLRSRLRPIRPERSLEDFFINRFGRELYRTFFEDYTEKVWGVPCRQIKPEWGAQRVKGLSVTKAILHALKSALAKEGDLSQKNTETSLIEQFLYPKFGPGQMWETVAQAIMERGGQIRLHHRVKGLNFNGGSLRSAVVQDMQTGTEAEAPGDYFFSSMPVRELIAAMGEVPPPDIRRTAAGLVYRDFITVGLLLKKLNIQNKTKRPSINGLIPDNWIYIQESDVKLGRLQVYNNWSPYMVRDPQTVWLGLEYFCNEGDALWQMAQEEILRFAAGELERIGVADEADVLDGVVIRMPKAYPAYFGTYDRFDRVRSFTDGVENLFLIGRNGMHRYNNMDHSMLTAMSAVDNILAGVRTKDNIWSVNAEEDYHEGK